MRSRRLVVAKLAPSGVAAHLIGGTTIHNFFALDIECNSRLEHGTTQATLVRKTDVLVIDEFSMLDFYLLRTAEGLCRKFARHGSSKHAWGGRHVLLLGDPAQLPAVSRTDIFGTTLWRQFSVLLPLLTSPMRGQGSSNHCVCMCMCVCVCVCVCVSVCLLPL